MSDDTLSIRREDVENVGRKYSAVFGFDTDVDRKKASGLIKRAHSGGRKRP